MSCLAAVGWFLVVDQHPPPPLPNFYSSTSIGLYVYCQHYQEQHWNHQVRGYRLKFGIPSSSPGINKSTSPPKFPTKLSTAQKKRYRAIAQHPAICVCTAGSREWSIYTNLACILQIELALQKQPISIFRPPCPLIQSQCKRR